MTEPEPEPVVETESAETEFVDRIISSHYGSVVIEIEEGFVMKAGPRVKL